MENSHKKFFIGFLLFFGMLEEVQSQSVLNNYLDEGLQNNLVLKEKNISLDQSILALKDAKSFFLPSIDFGATYTVADGGRAIVLPIGDLLNGVYSSLNTLLDRQAFPQIQNVEEQFLANNFYDARVRISYPVINPDLHFNKQIRDQSVRLEEFEIEIYKAELTKNIKQAYYKYCLAYTAKQILEESKILVQQNLKDNKSLLANGKGLPAQVLRAESEVENINSQLIEAENRMKNAAYYVNFLINRPIESEVIFETQSINEMEIDNLMQEEDFSDRAEIHKINTAKGIQETALRMNQNFAIPRLNTFADFGMQGFEFDVSDQSRYFMLGVNMSFPIFQGGRNRNAITRAKNEITNLTYQTELLDDSIEMAIRAAKNNIKAAEAAKYSAEQNLRSATAYLRLIDRGYKEGTNSLIEFIDARNQFTLSELKLTIANYSLLSAVAELERELQTLN
ncbi:TolC family protein [Aquiflexum gelatinilyticum]|jgi:outer membrane protein TolC|uniref:TolC family protein n=1 Tax=Aquiflexum gelatinilyticum TaxID=2961943 RepID=A0A9X2T2L4_9BACT|nr:TolC family protein [Aquiflexum gelatinilyticum]MCR9017031.1 TolC family protein [Aquiflexum gelatinilyticum]